MTLADAVSLLPLAAAAVCIVLAFLPLHRAIRRPVKTEAVVVRRAEQRIWRSGSEIVAYAPVIRYRTRTGERTVTLRRFVPEWQYRYRTGEQIKVCYSAEREEDVCILEQGGWRQGVLLTLGIGTAIAWIVLHVMY